MPAAGTYAWALFLDGTDFTDTVDEDRIVARTHAHASTGTLTAEVYDPTASLSVTTNMDTVLVGRKPGSTGSTTMAANSNVGVTNIKVASVTGFNAGDEIVIGEHPNAELRTITTVGTPGSGGTGITVSVALGNTHSTTDQVYEAERLFAGTIRRTVGRSAASAKVTKFIARDYTDLLGADVIDIAFRSVTESDKARVTWLVQTWGAKGVTAGDEVQQTLASMPPGSDGNPEQDFSGKSLQRAIEQVEKITAASHYVDEYKRLHYFLTESNTAPYSLSTSPNGTSSFGYHDFELPTDSVDTVNAVYVYGAVLESGQVRGWRPDPPPAAATRRAVVIRDTDVTSAAQLAVVGDAYLAEHGTDQVEGSLKTYRSGFRAGMSVQITNPHWGLSATTFYIQQVTLRLEKGIPIYDLDFGSEKATLGGTLGEAGRAADEALRVANAAPSAAVAAVADLSVAGANMLTNSSFESSSDLGWTVGAEWVFGFPPVGPDLAFSGSNVARLAPSGGAAEPLLTPLIAVDRLDDWWVSYWSFLRSRTSGSVQAAVRQYDSSQVYISGADLTLPSPGSTVETLWTRHSIHLGPNTEFGRTAFHANTAYIEVLWDDASTGTFVWDIDAVQVERGRLITAWAPTPYELRDGSITEEMFNGQISGTLISDGAITTPHLGALAVTTDKLAANAVVAGKIATGVITSDHIDTAGLNADRITSGELSLGGVAGAYLVVYDANSEEIGRWDANGLLISDESNPLLKMRLMNGELQFASEVDGGGNPLWRTAISAEGITADAILLGTFPGGSNRIANSGFEMAAFSTQFTKVWTANADWEATIGTEVNVPVTITGDVLSTDVSTY